MGLYPSKAFCIHLLGEVRGPFSQKAQRPKHKVTQQVTGGAVLEPSKWTPPMALLKLSPALRLLTLPSDDAARAKQIWEAL